MSQTKLTTKWILAEVKKINYSFGLNRVIRYNFKRDEKYETQSVAEHVYNMILLAHYFRKLEDPKNKLDFEKVIRIILVHDMTEIETGDIVMNEKTEDHKLIEQLSISKVKNNSPTFISKEIKKLCYEYDNLTTLEGKYVKAIDKIEQQLWHSVFCKYEMVEKCCTQKDRDRNELKRREIYEKCGFRIIEKFALTIHKDMCKRNPTYSSLD